MFGKHKNTADMRTHIIMEVVITRITTVPSVGRRLKMRLLMICVVIGGCAVAVARGWEVVGFAIAEAQARSDIAHPGDFAEWYGVPGLAGSALRATLIHSAFRGAPADVQKRTEQLTALLVVKPLSSVDWLALASARVVDAAPKDKVLSALTMSYVTGPNEGTLMLQRGIFGLIEWDILPKEVRAQTARDVASTLSEVSIPDHTVSIIKVALAATSADARSEIAALLAAERASEKQLARLGL
jgi:hypothetical protein